MVTTELAPNELFDPEAEEYVKIISIRADYRYHTRIDAFIYDAQDNSKKVKIGIDYIKEGISKNDDAATIKTIIKTKPVQAGVFRDGDSVVGSFIDAFFTAGDIESAAFEGAEKPLKYEIATRALQNSTSFPKGTELWDNIHLWGGYKDFHIPTAPGAAHAIHLHWRWGFSVWAADFGTETQFKEITFYPHVESEEGDVDVRTKIRGLVHPRAWVQDVNFAATKYDKTLDPSHKDNLQVDYGNFSKSEFLKLFTSRKKINNISDGCDMVVWYSVEFKDGLSMKIPSQKPVSSIPTFGSKTKFIDAKLLSDLNGTMLIQGIFFAHETEKSIASGDVGTQNRLHFPNDFDEIPYKWERNVSG